MQRLHLPKEVRRTLHNRPILEQYFNQRDAIIQKLFGYTLLSSYITRSINFNRVVSRRIQKRKTEIKNQIIKNKTSSLPANKYLQTQNDKILIKKGKQRERVNEIPGRKTREFQTGVARSQEECIEPAQCGLLPRKTEQSYATGRNPRNDFLPSYAVYIARAGPRHAYPSYPRFRHVKILLSGTLSCAKTDDERSIEWVESSPSATELTRGHVQEFIIPPSALRRHDDGGAVNILWVDEARVGCSWTVDGQICERS